MLDEDTFLMLCKKYEVTVDDEKIYELFAPINNLQTN